MIIAASPIAVLPVATNLASDTNTYTVVGSGGMVFGGAGVISRDRAVVGSGGMVFGGAGVVSRDRAIVGTGGLVFGGAGAVARTKVLAASGGIVLGGNGNATLFNAAAPPVVKGSSGGMIVNMGQLLSK